MNSDKIVDILKDLGASQIQVHARNVQCVCLLSDYKAAHRHGVTRPSMGISINPTGTSLVHCLSCNHKGSLLTTVKELEVNGEIDLKKVIKKIIRYEKLSPEDIIFNIESSLNKPKKAVVLEESELSIFNRAIHPYLLERGLKKKTLMKWESMWDANYSRVVFPVRDKNKKLVGAVGRTTIDDRIKYFNYLGLVKSYSLFGEQFIRNDSVVVVEGPIDAILLRQYCEENKLPYDVVAIYGTELSLSQKNKLSRNWKEVVLFLDNDPPGIEGSRKASGRLSSTIASVVSYPKTGGNDPAELILNNIDIGEILHSSVMVSLSSG